MGAALSALITGVFTLLSGWLTWILNNRKAKQEKRMEFMAKDFIEVGDILNTLLSETGCGRILVLKANNHGSRIRKDKPLFSSVVYEMHNPEIMPVKKNWQNQRADAHYAELVEELLEDDSVLQLSLEDLPEGDLRNAWVAYLTEQAEYVKLWASPDESKIVYMAVSYNKDLPPRNLEKASVREPMRHAISHLRNTMKELGPYL